MTDLRQQSIALEARLVDLYPALFTQATPRPLARGIHRQILAAHPEIDRNVLRMFLSFWTRRLGCLKSLKAAGADTALSPSLSAMATGLMRNSGLPACG